MHHKKKISTTPVYASRESYCKLLSGRLRGCAALDKLFEKTAGGSSAGDLGERTGKEVLTPLTAPGTRPLRTVDQKESYPGRREGKQSR